MLAPEDIQLLVKIGKSLQYNLAEAITDTLLYGIFISQWLDMSAKLTTTFQASTYCFSPYQQQYFCPYVFMVLPISF